MYDVVIVGGSLSAAGVALRCREAGLDTLVLERKKLPRHKVCSGILSPRGHRFLKEHFGEIPDEALHEPRLCRGVNFLFPDQSEMPMDFSAGPTPHLYRKYSDNWAIKSAGVQIEEETELISFKDVGNKVHVKIKGPAGPVEICTRYLVGADGPRSTVVDQLYPNYRDKMKWFMVMQKYYKASTPLSEEYFHFFIDHELGHYPWAHIESGQWIVGVGGFMADNMKERHKKVLDVMKNRHGFEIEEEIKKEGCPENFGLSLTNRYEFGKGRVLVTGQAAGFLNMMAEGMSCALHSGSHAGESIVEALRRKRDVEHIYRRRVQAEVNRCSDQWNVFKILTGQPHEADLKKGLFAQGPRQALYWGKEMIKFGKQFHGLGWGKDIMRSSVKRMLTGSYGEPNPH